MWVCYCDRCGNRITSRRGARAPLAVIWTDFEGEVEGAVKGTEFTLSLCDNCQVAIIGHVKAILSRREAPDAV